MTTTEIATEPEESKKAKRVREKDIPLHSREFGLQLDIRTKSPPSGLMPKQGRRYKYCIREDFCEKEIDPSV